MADSKIDRLIKRWKTLEGEKSQWHQHWEDLARVMLPRRMGFTTTQVEGERRTDDIFDGTPMQAARGLANALGGMLRPEGKKITEIEAEDDALNTSDEALDWMEDSEERLQNAYNNPKARMRQATGEADQDIVVFGTAVLFEGESRNRNSLLLQSLHLKDCTPVFNEEGAPEMLFRKRSFPVWQLEQKFGENKLSDPARKALKENPDKKFDALHIVMPRENGRSDAMFTTNLPISDLWVELEAKTSLAEGGFHEFPFIIPRWDTSSGESLGRSPGMIALPDADTLQAMGETILIAGQRAADPPLAAPNDGSFDAINTFPGGLSYYDVETAINLRGNPFFPIESGTNLPISRDMQADTREQIRNAFFKNVLNLPIRGPEMTATEILQRREEWMREIGPILGKLEADYTAPMVERGFMIMLRAGAFLPIPRALQGRNIIFKYESPVKRIQKQIAAAAARIWALETAELAQIKPEAIDIINEDEIVRFGAEALGIPRRLVNSAEIVAQIREARARAAQAQADAIGIQQGAETAKTMADAAKKAGLTEAA